MEGRGTTSHCSCQSEVKTLLPPLPPPIKKMLLNKLIFHGTKDYHKSVINIELREDDGLWRVLVMRPDGVVDRIVYEGNDKGAAENVFANGFSFHLAEEYQLACDETVKPGDVLITLHRVVESLYMRVLSGMGYKVDGRWEMKSYVKGFEEGSMDEIGLHMRKFIKENRIVEHLKGGDYVGSD